LLAAAASWVQNDGGWDSTAACHRGERSGISNASPATVSWSVEGYV